MREFLRKYGREWEYLGLNCGWEESGQGDRTVFYCFNRKMGRQREKGLRQWLGSVVAEYICSVNEPEMIRWIISRDFRYRQPDESREIERYAYHLLQDVEGEDLDQPYVHRKDQMARQVADYLLRNRFLAVDGFFHFRMKRYRRVLMKLVEHAIDEYLLDREYQEFIELLKYFVSVQKPKISLVHVLHTGKRRFQILKPDGSPLQLKEMDGVAQEMMDQTLSQEDLIVSTLLTVAPDRVILHTGYPTENVIRTLISIFENRITVCEGCFKCRSFSRSRGDG
ncbi:putative sporulation protein YtxC [Paludifilum halophilum]|nr:putative sporulation protein YtxC [Paludifilum halophilum]